MKFVKPPFFLKWLYPQVTYYRSREEKKVYLTFDDGPIPEVTPWVLDTLSAYDAKGTFFCVGDNVDKHSDIFSRIRSEGHAVGNHTHNHLKGWDCDNDVYFENVAECNRRVQSKLFRPPYMRAKRSQLKQLQKDYEIIFFDVLSYDFDPTVSADRCFANVMDNVQNGSIIVFHDNRKSFDTLQKVLPRVLDALKDRGYSFSELS